MSLTSIFASTSRSATQRTLPLTRHVSSSPYGRTHVWKHRTRRLPPPFVPQFPQRVVRADGSSFTQYTTSPRSEVRLARDTTNHPLWDASRWMAESEEEDAVTGRLGRFNRRFEGLGGLGADVDWMEEVAVEGESGEVKETKKEKEKEKK